MSVFVPRGVRQALDIRREAFLLWACAERRDPTKQFYIKMFFYDPVVLDQRSLNNDTLGPVSVRVTCSLQEESLSRVWPPKNVLGFFAEHYIMNVSSILYFQRKTTGSALISSKYR